MWELSSPVLRLAEGGSVRMCNFKKVRRWTSQKCNWILSVSMKSRWKAGGSPVLRLAEGAENVRMWESQGGRQRVASGRPTERTRSPGSLTKLTHPADSAFELKRVTTLVNEYGRGIMENWVFYFDRKKESRSPWSLINHRDSAFELAHVTSWFPC